MISCLKFFARLSENIFVIRRGSLFLGKQKNTFQGDRKDSIAVLILSYEYQKLQFVSFFLDVFKTSEKTDFNIYTFSKL